jgi:hypothetical protein
MPSRQEAPATQKVQTRQQDAPAAQQVTRQDSKT